MFQPWSVDFLLRSLDLEAIQYVLYAYYHVQQFIKPESLMFSARWLH